jgi:hypothetical protein
MESTDGLCGRLNAGRERYRKLRSGGRITRIIDLDQGRHHDAPVQGYTRTGIKPGEIWQYRVSVILVSGQRSAPSAVQVAPATVEPAPNPPTLKTVDTLAYEINKSTDALALNAVGTVALGVSCKPEYDANGLNVVPRNLVKFKTATKPLVVVAKCG